MHITIKFKDERGVRSALTRFNGIALDCCSCTVFASDNQQVVIEVFSHTLAVYILSVFTLELDCVVGGVDSIQIRSV